MASSLGRIALGVVGAVIGAPFGLSAIGFSIGSAIGGVLFAPEGPKVEGPRLGDTNVSASSLGKVIAEHYGVTRASGNMIWSGGLKEIKKEEDQGGGKGGGGGGGTVTTYHYSASYAMCMGRGPAKEVRKMWADGKLIYDGTGDSDTKNDKYKWRLLKGDDNQEVDPLIAESINRRLAGLPDVNKGNGPQADYTTLSELITQISGNSDGRSQLYAQRLTTLKAEAEAGDPSIPDYKFTPSYKGLCIIVFDDMKLEDFGNRIPNITAEIVWEGAAAGDGTAALEEVVPTGTAVPEISSTPVPDGLMATDFNNRKVFAHASGTMRRFSADTLAEDRQKEIPTDPADVFNGELNEYGYTIDRLLGTTSDGNVVAIGSAAYPFGWTGYTPQANSILYLSATGLEVIRTYPPLPAVPEFGSRVRIYGDYPTTLFDADAGEDVSTTEETGDYFAFVYLNGGTPTMSVMRMDSSGVTDTTIATGNDFFFGYNQLGPVVAGDSNGSSGDVLASTYSSAGFAVSRYTVTDNAIYNGYGENGGSNLYVNTAGTKSITNPFSSSISYISALVFDYGSDYVTVVLALSGGGTGIVTLDENLSEVFEVEIPGVNPPLPTSGLTRSDVSNNTLAFADGTDIVSINVATGTYEVYTGVLSASASNKAQLYVAEIAGLFLWEGGTPMVYRIGTVGGNSRDHDISALLPDVITSVCRRAGMEEDEFDVSEVSDLPVRGYNIARPSSGRQVLDQLMQAFFVDGVETDWAVKFSDRGTTSLRTISENELGSISGPTGDVNWLESRTPEYEIPAEINLNFSDPVRDYQTASAHKRRIANPIPSMYSNTVQNLELPLVMKEHEAADVAERLLFLSWMSRDMAKSQLNWTHVDLDPGDVISVRFNDGRIVTDRIAKATLGANFEIAMESARSGDPVYEPAPISIIPTGSVPSVNSPIPVNSQMFVMDIPLLYDYHSTGNSAARYYTAVGSESDDWTSATIFRSFDGNSYVAGDTVQVEVTWGDVLGTLGAPRALWATDHDNVLRVALGKDNGDISSVTREELLNGANRALVYNRSTGVGEIIQFQNAEIQDNGATVVLSTLTRGLRGTEYAADQHTTGEVFLLLKESDLQVNMVDLEAVGSTGYFKAVSAGQLITSVQARQRRLVGRSLMPYAPSRVRRSDNGSDLSISWVRRARVGGGWNMADAIETVPLVEDFEQYELYLLPSTEDALDNFDPANNGSYVEKVTVNTPGHTFDAATLASHGITLDDDINVVVYQISAQVGRGFPAKGRLAP